MNILKKICNKKIEDIKKLKKEIDYKKKIKIVKKREFLKNLLEKKTDRFNLIAEIKKSSPSKGDICLNFQPLEIALDYQKAGASCISVLTEENFFSGSIHFLSQIKKVVDLPLLRKDFIVDEWQIYESYFFGADCILLILAILDDKQMLHFYKIAKELELDVIVEVHDDQELERALKLKVECIGINNRNLKTLKIDLNTFKKLSKKIPKDIIRICESGISKNSQIREYTSYGADGFLVGESLMSSANIKKETLKLIKK